MTKISIVIPVFNNWNYTKYCLDNLIKYDLCEIIIVDNGSSDQTIEAIKTYIQPLQSNNIKCIRNSENKGFGYACNQGYKESSSDIIMFLNNDIKFISHDLSWVDNLCNAIDIFDKPSLFGPTGGYVDISRDFDFKYETSNNLMKINYMSGWCVAAKRSTWETLILLGNDGPFDAKTFFAYFEDTDLGFRALLNDIAFCLYSVPVSHIGKQTSKNLNTSKLYFESKLKFLKKWEKFKKQLNIKMSKRFPNK